MTKTEIVSRLLDPGIIAIIRADSSAGLLDAAQALLDGGVTAIEVTMNTPDALRLISDVTAKFSDRIVMGVGTVLDADSCRAAILAGAEFVVTPTVRPEVIRISNRYEKPVACGAFTPTEALTAHEAGADFIKVFPAHTGGPKHISAMLAPLPMLRIIPTGGITLANLGDYVRAGSVAVGVGTELISREILKKRDWPSLRARATEFVQAVQQARKKPH